MNILSEIIRRKREQVEAVKQTAAFDTAYDTARGVRANATSHSFLTALSATDGINIIAEFKRRSPSKRDIRNDADPVEIARDYQTAGAVAISVLTEENYFDGSLDDLRVIREVVELPLLRKDFIFDEYQIYEAAAAGADA